MVDIGFYGEVIDGFLEKENQIFSKMLLFDKNSKLNKNKFDDDDGDDDDDDGDDDDDKEEEEEEEIEDYNDDNSDNSLLSHSDDNDDDSVSSSDHLKKVKNSSQKVVENNLFPSNEYYLELTNVFTYGFWSSKRFKLMHTKNCSSIENLFTQKKSSSRSFKPDHDFISIQRNIEMLVFKLLVEVNISPKSLKYKIKIYDLLSSLQSTEFSNIIINSLSYLRSNNINIQADLNSKIGLDDKKENLL